MIAGLAIFFGGAWLLDRAGDDRVRLVAVVLMLIGFGSAVLVKLWYWTVHTRLRVTEDVNRLHLALAGESAVAVGGAEARPESPLPPAGGSRWNRISVSALGRGSIARVVAIGLAGGMLLFGPLAVPHGGPALPGNA